MHAQSTYRICHVKQFKVVNVDYLLLLLLLRSMKYILKYILSDLHMQHLSAAANKQKFRVQGMSENKTFKNK